MPANNRVHSSAALQTHGIWQSAIGYDPYAPTAKDDGKKASMTSKASDPAEPEPENAYASFQGLLALARITNSNSDEARGSCKKCGRVGHLTYQCRNFLSAREDVSRAGKVDDDVIREVVLEKLKGEKVKGLLKKEGLEGGDSSEDEEEEEDSESSDSDYDSEMERIIAEKYGKKVNGKAKVGSRRKAEEDDDDEDEEDRRKRRGRSRKRRNRKRETNDSEDEERRKRKKERRNRDDDESSDEEDESKRRKKRKSRKERRRRRSHRHSSDYSDASPEDSGERRRKRRSRRTASTSDSDDTGSDDPRVGRDKRRSEKKSRMSRHGK